MAISMYSASVPALVRSLNNLVGILEKGAAYAEAKQVESTVLLNTRLYPDMFPLVRQVQIASDISRRGVARLAGLEAPSIEDNEKTFPELIARLKNTISYLETFAQEQIDGSEEKPIALPIRDEVFHFQGFPYLNFFILPNVYFHVTTAYDILRHCGVELGKIDFLGKPEVGSGLAE
ncbi:MAG: DUF1993 family protein [Microcoleaceae cyanobacterium]